MARPPAPEAAWWPEEVTATLGAYAPTAAPAPPPQTLKITPEQRRLALVAGGTALVVAIVSAIVFSFADGGGVPEPGVSPGPRVVAAQPETVPAMPSSSPTPSSLGYAMEYRDQRFTIPATECSGSINLVRVGFGESGPSVSVDGWMSSDFNFDCAEDKAPQVFFGSNDGRAALAGTATDGATCRQVIATNPIRPTVNLASLKEGSRLCAEYPERVVLLELVQKAANNKTVWSVSSWAIPS